MHLSSGQHFLFHDSFGCLRKKYFKMLHICATCILIYVCLHHVMQMALHDWLPISGTHSIVSILHVVHKLQWSWSTTYSLLFANVIFTSLNYVTTQLGCQQSCFTTAFSIFSYCFGPYIIPVMFSFDIFPGEWFFTGTEPFYN